VARAQSASSTPCEQIAFQVTLEPGSAERYRVVGELCDPAPEQPRTLQLLLHGATYDHSYWNFAYQPQHYSYARAANQAGFATLALDRLGSGASDHPPGSAITTNGSAFTVHQVISALRAGAARTDSGRTVRFDRIVLVGHSFGSFIAWAEAATYRDVDGLIISGTSHLEDPPGAAAIEATLYPAAFDPRFAGAGLSLDYFTTLPGVRGADFYYLPHTDPAVLALDEATKDVVPLGLFFDRTSTYAMTREIHVPVLGVVGDYDTLSCEAPSCSRSGSFQSEGSYYPADACFSSFVLQNAGHDLNLHRNAPAWFAHAQSWARAYVGADPQQPASVRCR
jgi:pimeloyl-ACP methyl ester carboxylesterase